MSSTKRGAVRQTEDYYPTPGWCVLSLLKKLEPSSSWPWLEPCCGDGAIIRAANKHYEALGKPLPDWYATDIRQTAVDECRKIKAVRSASRGDFLSEAFRERARLPPVRAIITNPPYQLAQKFLLACLSGWPNAMVAMLLRLNYLGSQSRAEFWRTYMADVYVLSKRPSFSYKGTDSAEYAWFVWPPGRKVRRAGQVSVLKIVEDVL